MSGPNPILANGSTITAVVSEIVVRASNSQGVSFPGFGSDVHAIGTANAAGTDNTAARTDHVHAHGNQTDPLMHALATEIAAGFMSSADKTKLDGLSPFAGFGDTALTVGTVNDGGTADTGSRSDHVHAHGSQSDPALHAIATESDNGFLSSSDKAKLDGVASGAAAVGSATPLSVTASSPAVGSSASASRQDHVHDLANGAIVEAKLSSTLSVPVQVYARASLPSPDGKNRLGKLSDFNKGLVRSNGSAWLPSSDSVVFNPIDFGADPTGVSDSSAAINAAIVAMSTTGDINSPGYQLFFSPGVYRLSSSIDIVRRVILDGGSTINNQATPGTYLKPDVGVIPIVIHFGGDGSSDGGEGSWSQLRNVAIKGTRAPAWTATTTITLNSYVEPTGYSQYVFQATAVSSDAKTGGVEPTWPALQYLATTFGSDGATVVDNHVTWTARYRPGIYAKARARLDNITISDISGDGFAVVADTGASPATAANGFRADQILIQNVNGDGVYIQGGDANAGIFNGIDVEGYKGWGVWDYAFLGNTHIGHQVAPGGSCQGPYRANNVNGRSQFISCYAEGGSGNSEIISPNMVFGGFAAENITGGSNGFVMDNGGVVRTSMGFKRAADGTNLQLGKGNYGILQFASNSGSQLPYGLAYQFTRTGWWSFNFAAADTYDAFAISTNDGAEPAGRAWTLNGLYLGHADGDLHKPGPYLISSTAAPVSGTFVTGDFVLNTTPSSTSPFGWRCTSGGTPGTWQALYSSPFDSTHPGTVPLSGGGSTNFLRADGTWSVPSGTSTGDVVGPASSSAFNLPQFADGTGKLLSDSGVSSAYVPNFDQHDALVGTYGDPSNSNRYVTDSDPRVFCPVVPLTINAVLTAAQTGTFYTNEGASGAVVLTLPDATLAGSASVRYRFSTDAAFSFTVLAQGTDVIRFGTTVSSAGGSVSSSAVGSSFELVRSKSGVWTSFSGMGTWVIS